MPDISKINALAIGSVSKVDGLAKASILDIDGVAVPAGVAPPLDTYTGASAAYSIRRLRTAYSGPIMRVRRTSDNVEADIGFDSNDEFGLTSPVTNPSSGGPFTDFADFIGHTGTPTNGYVRKWYDQSGNANDGDQPTANQQCSIYSGGAINVLNGKPVLNPAGGNAQLPTGLAGDTSYKVFSVSSVYAPTSTHVLLGTNNSSDYHLAMEPGSTNVLLSSNGGATIRKNGATYSLTGKTRGDLHTDFTGQHLLYSDHDVTTTAGRTLQLGYTSGNRMLQSQEVIIYPSTSTHTVSDIEDNQNAYFGIY